MDGTLDGPTPPAVDDATLDGAGAAPPDSRVKPGGASRPASVAPPGAPSVRGYHIKGKLGEGGRGTVWLAQQAKPRPLPASELPSRNCRGA